MRIRLQHRRSAQQWVHHTQWVRALRRLGRSADRIAPAAMEFLRRAWPRFSTELHSRVRTLHFHPQIHLAWRTDLLHLHSLFIHRGGGAPPILVPPVNTPRRERLPQPAALPPPAVRATFETLRWSAFTFRFDRLETRSSALTERLSQTFAAQASASGVSGLREVESVRRIMIERSRRIEEYVPRATTAVARRQVAPAVAPAGAAMPVAERAAAISREPVETVHVAPWLRTASPNAVNVEQLTEQVIRQIDSRMIAWRERMGKI
jgi:hypothetical protein